MLKAPDGTPLETEQKRQAEEAKLRGQKINEIREDLNDDEMDKEQKALKYSSHLSWFLDKVKTLYRVQQATTQKGAYDKTTYTVGIANGVVMAMAIFMEEQGRPPYRSIPNKLEKRDDEILAEKVKGFIITLITQLEAVICIDAESNKPKGYEKYELQEAYAQWHHDTIEHMQNCPVSFPELQASINRIIEYHENMEE